MRKVILIKDLVVDEVMSSRESIEVQRFGGIAPINLGDGSFAFNDNSAIDINYVPIHRICRQTENERTDTYIAYTKEVQELIGAPFDAMSNEISTLQSLAASQRKSILIESKKATDLQKRINSVSKMTIIKKLSFLFGYHKI